MTYVRPTTIDEVSQKWGFPVPLYGDLFVECDDVGGVDWEEALVYRKEELTDDFRIVA